jgi:hypothetical protein
LPRPPWLHQSSGTFRGVVLDAAVEPSMLSTSAAAYVSTGKSAGIVNLSALDDDSLVILGPRPPTSGRAWR